MQGLLVQEMIVMRHCRGPSGKEKNNYKGPTNTQSNLLKNNISISPKGMLKHFKRYSVLFLENHKINGMAMTVGTTLLCPFCQAVAFTELSVEILKALAGEDHPRTHTAMRNLGKVGRRAELQMDLWHVSDIYCFKHL